ncbi:MAG: hypothetical protein GXZ03_04215 [Proteiniphilum sp.]|nr:hypothetical protein [Proteiniphilum sp.]
MTFNLAIVAALIFLGVLLILIEIFLLPGFGIAGIGGIAFMGGGVFFAYSYIGATAGTITLLLSLLLLGGGFAWLIKSKSLSKIALTADIAETVDKSELKKLAKGDIGTTISRLNPIGKVMFGEVIVEGKSFSGELIDEDTEVEVLYVDSFNVIVKSKNKETTL